MMVHVGNCMSYYIGCIVATTIIGNDMLSQLVCAVRDPLVTKHSLPIESELKCWIYSYIGGGPKNSGTSCLQGTLGGKHRSAGEPKWPDMAGTFQPYLSTRPSELPSGFTREHALATNHRFRGKIRLINIDLHEAPLP
jgi:hypothetical protein